MKSAVIFAFTDKGCALSQSVIKILSDNDYACLVQTTDKLAEKYGLAAFGRIGRAAGEAFQTREVLVFIGGCGIAVRAIAPYIADKATDPAVIVIDDNGKFVVPILSGHIGGANALGAAIAEKLGAVSVITTATDVNKKFSPDAWAAANGLAIGDMDIAKAVSAGILTDDIPLKCDFPLRGALPNGVVMGNSGSLGIYISYKTAQPFERTLRLIPRVLHVGIGCRKNIDGQSILELLADVFKTNCWDMAAIKSVSSIDIKRGEAGLLRACEKLKITPAFYSAAELAAVPGGFTESEYVRSVTGVDNVCERAAVLASGGGRLVILKTARNGVTVAVAEQSWEACF
jgi:cobalt-precorrin 5A hydrolase